MRVLHGKLDCTLEMATEELCRSSGFHSILVIFSFGLIWSGCCLELTDFPQIRCEFVEVAFVSSNGIRIRWNVTGLPQQQQGFIQISKCQLRLSQESCDDPLQQIEADISTPISVCIHTFWIHDKTHTTTLQTKSYKACIRLDTSDDGVWQEQNLTVNGRLPPTIRNCSISIGTEFRGTRIERSKSFIYRNGDTVTMSCDVDGRPFLRVKWCRNAIECNANQSSSASSSLVLANANRQNEGVYFATVENKFGRIISEGIYIRQAVLEDYELNDQPKSVSHKAGDSFTLSCKAPVCVPAPEIRWTKKRSGGAGEQIPIEFNQRTVLGLDGSLTILSAQVNDSGVYACKVTNRVIDQHLLSGETIVEISSEKIFPVQPNIENKGQATILGLVGDMQRLECIFSGRPRPDVHWFKDEQLLRLSELDKQRLNFSTDGFTLTILSLTLQDSGHYQCKANNSEGRSESTIQIIVQEKPSIVRILEPKNATEGETVEFICSGSGIPQPRIEWRIDGRIVTEEIESSLNVSISEDSSSLTFFNVSLNKACALQCNATNDYGYAVSGTSLNVFAPTRVQSLKLVDVGGDRLRLTCEASTDALTPLSFNWTRGQTKITSSDETFTVFHNGSLLVNVTASRQSSSDLNGNYTCLAYNGFSTDTQTIPVAFVLEKKESVFQTLETIGLPGIILFGVLMMILITMVIVLMVLRKQKQRKIRTASSFGNSVLIMPQLSYSSHTESRSTGSHEGLVHEADLLTGIQLQNELLRASIRQMYINRERIQLLNIVGKGQFGRVYSAYLRDPRDIVEEVAVKTMKYKPDESEMVELFLREAVIMRDFQHMHVLGVRGITFDTDRSPMVILPFMANGDLRRYILQPNLDITILQLLLMGLQVARGMHYLSQMRFVHRDLAARNCMVNDRGIVKVADFGLSRQMVRDYYRVESSGTTPVPVRWMAPECLEANLFTTMSDVWSFGVLLWELMTRGAVPYPDVENWQISNHVQSGKRLEQPLYCPDIIYEIMRSCWEVEQSNRPSFQDLVDSIQNVVQSAGAKPGARSSSALYQNIVHNGGGSVSDSGLERSCSQDYRQNALNLI